MRKISIVGSGLVGSLWAYVLKQRNYDVEVFEKRGDPRKLQQQAGRSINLVITSRGLNALKNAGLADKILPLTVPVYGRRIHPKTGDTFFQPYGRDKRDCNYSVSRAELNKALISECENAGVKIHFNHSLEAIDIEAKTLVFKTDGENSSCHYDLLFAADGAGSNVRKKITAAYPNEFSETTDWLTSGYKELFMPKPLEKNELHIWPRGTHMMMGLANLDGSFTMTLYLPNEGAAYSLKNLHTADKIQEFFKSEFASAIPHMPDYLSDYLSHPQGNLGTVKMNKWVYGDSLAFIGDAAHAIVPFFGQGMNLGFEDCSVLLNLLDQLGDWQKVLAAYDKFQRPNANAIAEMALENFVEMRDKVSDPKFQFKKKIEHVIENAFPELYRSRYGMITYTLIPYQVAQEAGLWQNQMLESLASGITDPAQLDLKIVKSLLETEFAPWLKQKGYSTESFSLE